MNQRLVMLEERRLGIKLSLNQRFADKDLAGQFRVMLRIGHRAASIDRESIESAFFKRYHFTALLFPMRFSPAFLDKVSADPLNPLRRHIRDTAGKQPGRFHDFSRHNPGTAFLRPGRPRPDPEPDTAGSHIRRRPEISVNPPHTDRAEKTSEE